MNGRTNALVGGATAQIAVHGGVDLRIGGMGGFRQQSNGGHDLAGLTITALRHIQRYPSLFNRLSNRALNPINGGYLVTDGILYRGLT